MSQVCVLKASSSVIYVFIQRQNHNIHNQHPAIHMYASLLLHLLVNRYNAEILCNLRTRSHNWSTNYNLRKSQRDHMTKNLILRKYQNCNAKHHQGNHALMRYISSILYRQNNEQSISTDHTSNTEIPDNQYANQGISYP